MNKFVSLYSRIKLIQIEKQMKLKFYENSKTPSLDLKLLVLKKSVFEVYLLNRPPQSTAEISNFSECGTAFIVSYSSYVNCINKIDLLTSET